MYLPRSILNVLDAPARIVDPAGPLQERLAGRRPRLGGIQDPLEYLGSIRRIRWRAISRMRRAVPGAREEAAAWTC